MLVERAALLPTAGGGVASGERRRPWGHRGESQESGERSVPPRTPTPCPRLHTCCARVADGAGIAWSMELKRRGRFDTAGGSLQDVLSNDIVKTVG